MQTWGEPDRNGIRTLRVDIGAISTIRARRWRRNDTVQSDAVDAWPATWKEILRRWLWWDWERRRWPTLLGLAGAQGAVLAHDLAAALLENGFIEIGESRNKGTWDIISLKFLAATELRRKIGLEDPSQVIREWETSSGVKLHSEELQRIKTKLGDTPSKPALARLKLLLSLDEWTLDGRDGTERDFALYARGSTKGISSAEWKWLKSNLELGSLGISPHTPAIYLRAPLTLIVEGEKACNSLDLAGVPDFSALTPLTIERTKQIQGAIDSWFVYENRTSFERGARLHGDHAGVVWIPGFPPSWWIKSMDRLLKLSPAPGKISCDLDPAGILIARQAGELWNRNGINWSPWQMSVTDLRGLNQVQKLSESDMKTLCHLKGVKLHDVLRALASSIEELGIKAEQEGLPSI